MKLMILAFFLIGIVIVNSGNKVAFLVSQSATEDFKKVKPGFDLIFKTFMVK